MKIRPLIIVGLPRYNIKGRSSSGEVQYTLHEDYLEAERQCNPFYIWNRAHLSDLLLQNQVLKEILHEDAWAWYPPTNPEFPFNCIIENCRQTKLFRNITGANFRWSAKEVHVCLLSIFLSRITVAKRPCCGQLKLKPSYNIVWYYVFI